MSLDLSAEDRKALAKDLAAELDTGRYGSRFVLSRRQLLSIAGGSAGVAGLVALGVDPATAQSAAGQVGTQSSPEDIYAFNLDVQGALQRDLDAGGQAITNAGSVSTKVLSVNEQAARIAQTSSQSVPDSSVTQVEFDLQDGDYNPGDVLTVDISNNKMVAEKAGTYIVNASCGYGSPGDGTRVQTIARVDNLIRNENQIPVGANDQTVISATAIARVTDPPADIIAETFQTSGGAIDTRGNPKEVDLEVSRIG